MKRNYRFSPLLLLAMAFPAAVGVEASEIRDRAGMFSPEAVKKAKSELDQIERRTRIPVVIETIDSIPGLERSAPNNARRKAIDELAVSRMEKERDAGVYLLISSRDRVLSNVLVRSRDAARLPEQTRIAIFNDLLDHFKEKKFDEGLLGAVAHLDRSLTAPSSGRVNGRVPAAPVPGGQAGNVHGARFGVGSLLMIGLGIFVVLILLRARRALRPLSRRLFLAHGDGRNASPGHGTWARWIRSARIWRLRGSPRRWILLGHAGRTGRCPCRQLAL